MIQKSHFCYLGSIRVSLSYSNMIAHGMTFYPFYMSCNVIFESMSKVNKLMISAVGQEMIIL